MRTVASKTQTVDTVSAQAWMSTSQMIGIESLALPHAPRVTAGNFD